jgi:hypothetical protein
MTMTEEKKTASEVLARANEPAKKISKAAHVLKLMDDLNFKIAPINILFLDDLNNDIDNRKLSL